MKRFLASAIVLLFVTVLAGCEHAEQPALQLSDITGAKFGRDFKLTDHNGRVRTLADFRGKVLSLR